MPILRLELWEPPESTQMVPITLAMEVMDRSVYGERIMLLGYGHRRWKKERLTILILIIQECGFLGFEAFGKASLGKLHTVEPESLIILKQDLIRGKIIIF